MTGPSPSPGAGDPSAANADPPRPDNGGSSEANTTPAVHDAQAAAESYDKQLAALRKSADLSSKALGAIATTVATAFGVTKLSSVFPQPSGVDWGWFLVLYGGLAVALAGVVLIASRLWNVGQPIPTQSDVHNMKVEAGLDAGEERLVRGVYQEAANLQNAGSLLAYEARGYRLERAASQLQAPDQSASQLTSNLQAEATQIRAEVGAAHSRAAYLVARRRAANVFTDWPAFGAYGLFVAGLVAVSLGNSYLAARTTDPDGGYTLAKDCTDLAKAAAGAGQTLKIRTCNAVIAPKTSTAQASATNTSTTPALTAPTSSSSARK